MKKLFNTLTLAGMLLFMSEVSFAIKGDNQIRGMVVDKNSQQPIEYASVILLSLPDSTVRASVLTDSAGSYLLNGFADGSYLLRVHFVGYKPALSESFVAGSTRELKPIALSSTAAIKEVTVVGKRPFIEKKADRTVLNIDSSPAAAAENAYEVLRKAPNVDVDKDDNININGKAGVTVLINDRPTHLSGADLANYLKSVQGAEIEKVEIINTPPARYDAAGNTGIINIKIKRNNKPGLNGSINGGITYNGKVGGSGGVSLNMRTSKANVYASYNPGSFVGSNINLLKRTIDFENSKVTLTQPIETPWRFNNNSFKFGADYDINKNNTVGIMVSGYSNCERQDLTGTTYFTSLTNLPDSSIDSFTKIHDTYKSMLYNANYKSTFDGSGRILNVDADYGTFKNHGGNTTTTSYMNSAGNAVREPLMLRSEAPATITIKSLKVDYEQPFGNGLKMELGAKGSLVNTDNDLRYELFKANQWGNDPSRSNHFVYDENIVAAYASLAYEYKNTSIKGGLRGENTWSKGNSLTDKKVVKRSYFDLFPTFYVQQKLNENNNVGFSYNYRIDRPRYDEMNPFRVYLDEYTYVVGNPYLNPQYTHNIAVSYSWKNMLFSELTYSHTKDVMMQDMEQNDTTKVVYQSRKNLNSLNGITWVNSLSFSPARWYRTTNNFTMIYNSYEKGTGSDLVENSKLTARITSVNSFTLPKKLVLELTGWYMSPFAWGMFKLQSMWMVNLGVQKSFMEDKLTVKLSVYDVFNSMQNVGTAKYDNVDLYTKNRWKSQRVSVNFTYRFGKSDLKPSRKRSSGMDDEQNRIVSGKN